MAGGVAAAEPVPLADVMQSADTDDGWHLSASLTNMTINLSQGANLSLGADLGAGFGFGSAPNLISPSPFFDIYPSVSVNLLPGHIANMGLGKKSLKGRTGEIFVHDAHVRVDACGGPVSIRLFASGADQHR
jgi:hypothetical protein